MCADLYRSVSAVFYSALIEPDFKFQRFLERLTQRDRQTNRHCGGGRKGEDKETESAGDENRKWERARDRQTGRQTDRDRERTDRDSKIEIKTDRAREKEVYLT